MERFVLLVVCSALVFSSTFALAQENSYFPTVPGSSWNYETLAGETVSTTVLGAEVFHGRSVIGVDQLTTRSTGEQLIGYKYFLDAAGNLYFAGWRLPQSWQDINTIHSPFPLKLPAAAEMQPSWQAAYIDSTYFGDTFTYEVQQNVVHVYQADEEITVPAGTFQALRITTQWNEGSTIVTWYSSGVGVVQFVDSVGHEFQLVDYQLGTVPSEESSWGGVKSLYRN